MDRELIQDYLQRAQMHEAQAEALSRIFAEMGTKSDLLVLNRDVSGRMESLEARLSGRMESLEARLMSKMESLESRLMGQMAQQKAETGVQMAQLESRLTWRMIAVVGFFATAATILNAFIG